LVACPETVRPGTHGSRYAKYHSTSCYNWTWHRRRDHLHLGERYIKGEHTKEHSPKQCQAGWTIQDGVIAPCIELFTQGRTDKIYHSSECFFQTRRWRQLGYSLGDLVRRTCTYRRCKKGDGGARGTFDQIHRSKSGRYFCDPRCKAAENRACEADKIAKEMATLRDKVASIEARELIPSPLIDMKKIALAARLELDGAKQAREMADGLYPPAPRVSDLAKREQKADRKRRIDRTKKFRARNRKRIDLEKERQSGRAGSTAIAS
jgi:hypothetical protein